MSSLENRTNAELLTLWRTGNQRAATVLVQRYMLRMTALVRSRLSRTLAKRVDPEDIVLSAWRSFFVAADIGPEIVANDNDLWPLLVTISFRKLARQAARHTAGRRNVHLDRELNLEEEWRNILARDPSPEDAVVLTDEIRAILSQLDHPDREMLVLKLRGQDAIEIAHQMNCSERTVRRSLQRIRNIISDRRSNELSLEIDFPLQNIEVNIADACYPEDSIIAPTMQFQNLTLQKLIGQGGFGKVYRAMNRLDGRIVAVKYLKKRFWSDQRAKASYMRESHIVSQLNHAAIIQHYGWGVTPAGNIFIVMEWVDGIDVREWMKSSISICEILDCGIAIADALNAAHQASIVHGDITPGNLLKRSDNTFVLTDFGFARSLSQSGLGSPGGTPNFLAPEQVSDVFGEIGFHTDIYGLGGLLYVLISGYFPIPGADIADVLAQVVSAKPIDMHPLTQSEIPKELMTLISRCLHKEPRQRPASMQDVLKSLQEIRRLL